MTNFVVCQSKQSGRVALIPENDISQKEWSPNGQIIQADSWINAREEVDTSLMFEDSPYGWYYR